MKSISSFLMATLCFSAAGFASTTSNLSNNDRIEFEDGQTAITHTENFELVCDLLVPETSATNPTIYIESKAWVDLDYTGGTTKYRLAFGFPTGGPIPIENPDGSIQLVFAAEKEIASVTPDGKLVTKSSPGDPAVTVELKKNRSGTVVGIEGISDDSKVAYSGNCTLNEVP